MEQANEMRIESNLQDNEAARAELAKRDAMKLNDVSSQSIIEKYLTGYADLAKQASVGIIDNSQFNIQLGVLNEDLIAKLTVINPNAAAYLGNHIKNLTVVQTYNYLQAVKSNFVRYTTAGIDRDFLKTVKLATYKDELDGYIEQSKKLINSLPVKLRKIIDDMKALQTEEYARLKKLGSNRDVNNRIKEVPRENINGLANLINLQPLKDRAGAEIPSGSISYLAISGLPRAFYCKLPSVLAGVPHDLLMISGLATGEDSLDAKKLLLQVKNLGKRVYNFKYKAWWGPMVRIVGDLPNMAATNAKIVIILRVAASPSVIESVLNSAPVTMYNLSSNAAYVGYVEQLVKVRSLNFKLKRTVQRFQRNHMAKFLNTDKQIIQEIGDYTNLVVK